MPLSPDNNYWSMDIQLEACNGQHHSVTRPLYQYAKQITGLFIFSRTECQSPCHKSPLLNPYKYEIYISIFIEIFRHAVGGQNTFLSSPRMS